MVGKAGAGATQFQTHMPTATAQEVKDQPRHDIEKRPMRDMAKRIVAEERVQSVVRSNDPKKISHLLEINYEKRLELESAAKAFSDGEKKAIAAMEETKKANLVAMQTIDLLKAELEAKKEVEQKGKEMAAAFEKRIQELEQQVQLLQKEKDTPKVQHQQILEKQDAGKKIKKHRTKRIRSLKGESKTVRRKVADVRMENNLKNVGRISEMISYAIAREENRWKMPWKLASSGEPRIFALLPFQWNSQEDIRLLPHEKIKFITGINKVIECAQKFLNRFEDQKVKLELHLLVEDLDIDLIEDFNETVANLETSNVLTKTEMLYTLESMKHVYQLANKFEKRRIDGVDQIPTKNDSYKLDDYNYEIRFL